MEAYIKRIVGDKLSATKCHFCDKTENLRLMGITTKEGASGSLFYFYGICPEHIKIFEKILNKEIELEKGNIPITNVINFR